MRFLGLFAAVRVVLQIPELRARRAAAAGVAARYCAAPSPPRCHAAVTSDVALLSLSTATRASRDDASGT